MDSVDLTGADAQRGLGLGPIAVSLPRDLGRDGRASHYLTSPPPTEYTLETGEAENGKRTEGTQSLTLQDELAKQVSLTDAFEHHDSNPPVGLGRILLR